ncbi:MAG: hypothetical protein ABSE48_21820 [Verrucomicrobiota bacterium]|jgi:hypothetical protein
MIERKWENFDQTTREKFRVAKIRERAAERPSIIVLSASDLLQYKQPFLVTFTQPDQEMNWRMMTFIILTYEIARKFQKIVCHLNETHASQKATPPLSPSKIIGSQFPSNY